MRIAVYGAGAIGGHLAVSLAGAGAQVSVVARGAHLDAIGTHGLRMGARTARLPASADAAAFGPQDAVFITLKSHQLPAALKGVSALLGPETAVVTAMNGLPYWYFHGQGGRRIESVDPGGRIRAAIAPERAIGCITFVAAEVSAPGVIHHTGGAEYRMGEPDGRRSPRLMALAALLREAGIGVQVSGDIRADIWLKLLANVSISPVSALTGASVGEAAQDKGARRRIRDAMEECKAVARAFGVEIPIATEDRIDKTAAFTTHRPSMLQDIERGRPPEIDPLLGSVRELGRMAGVETPVLDALYALIRLRAASKR